MAQRQKKEKKTLNSHAENISFLSAHGFAKKYFPVNDGVVAFSSLFKCKLEEDRTYFAYRERACVCVCVREREREREGEREREENIGLSVRAGIHAWDLLWGSN